MSLLLRLEGFETAFFTTGEQLLEASDTRRPDAIVLATSTLDIPWSSVLNTVKARKNGIAVVMVIDKHDVESAIEALKLGASDIVPRPIDPERMMRAIYAALRRDIQVSKDVGAGGQRVEVRGFAHLTNREREVLQMIVDGHTNKETGRRLKISPRTVEVHRSRVMHKLGAKNSPDLMRIVLTS